MLLFLGSPGYVDDLIKLCILWKNTARILVHYSSLPPVWQDPGGLCAFGIKGKAKHMNKTKWYL